MNSQQIAIANAAPASYPFTRAPEFPAVAFAEIRDRNPLISNRNFSRLEIAVTPTKHSPDPKSNRNFRSTCFYASHAFPGVRKVAPATYRSATHTSPRYHDGSHVVAPLSAWPVFAAQRANAHDNVCAHPTSHQHRVSVPSAFLGVLCEMFHAFDVAFDFAFVALPTPNF